VHICVLAITYTCEYSVTTLSSVEVVQLNPLVLQHSTALTSGDGPPSHDKSPPKVALIGAAAFAFICKQPSTELFFMSYKESEGVTVELSNQELEPSATP
jgi:hypothetical protein